jgi:hypothetical protein
MKTIHARKRYGVATVVFLVLVLTAGCAKPKGSISGKVLYKDKPLTGGFITFIVANGPSLSAKIQSNGEYRIDNVPVGEVKITIQPETATGADFIEKGGPRLPKTPDEMKQMMMPKAQVKFPKKYSDPQQTDLTYTVKEGSQEHDIVLTGTITMDRQDFKDPKGRKRGIK